MAFTSKNPRFTSTILTDALATTPSSPPSGAHKVIDRNGQLFVMDSSGVETPVGGGAGEKNYILSPSTAVGWTASGAGITVTTDTTVAELPRGLTTKTGIKITGVSGSTAYAYYRFTLDAADYNRKLKIKLDMMPVSGYAASDFKVDLYSNTTSAYNGTSTRVVTSSDASAICAIPNLTGQFQTTVDMPGSTAPYMELRIGLNGTNTHAVVFSDIVVGPGLQPQGAVVGEWQSYTPTLGIGVRGTNTEKAYWRRIGSAMQIIYTYLQTVGGTAGSGNYTWSIPTGYTMDTTEVTLTSSNIGNAYVYNGATEYPGYVIAQTSTAVALGLWTSISATTIGSNSNMSFGGATLRVHFTCLVPIAEWAGSGTVNVVQNDVEFAASTTGTWDATAAAGNTVYGPAGAPISGALTANRTKVVRFQTPIQQTDRIYLEYQMNNTVDQWIDAGQSFSNTVYMPTVQTGAWISETTATDVTVTFAQYAAPGTTYNSGTGAAAWSSASWSAWRLRKTASGQAVGFGNVAQSTSGLVKSAGQLLGTNTNDVAAAGYVGELQIQSLAAGSATSLVTGTAKNITTAMSLTAGQWELSGLLAVTPAASTSLTYLIASISQTTGTLSSAVGVPNSSGEIYVQLSNAAEVPGANYVMLPIPPIPVQLSSTTSFYLVAQAGFSVSTLTGFGHIRAVRIR